MKYFFANAFLLGIIGLFVWGLFGGVPFALIALGVISYAIGSK